MAPPHRMVKVCLHLMKDKSVQSYHPKNRSTSNLALKVLAGIDLPGWTTYILTKIMPVAETGWFLNRRQSFSSKTGRHIWRCESSGRKDRLGFSLALESPLQEIFLFA